MKKYLLFAGVLLTLISCKKIVLDSLAFPSEKLEAYAFENYTGSNELDLDASMFADAAHYTFVTLTSEDLANETTHTIYGVYIGDVSTMASDTVILYFHGQSLHMDAYFDRASLLANLGGKYNYSVFMIDYRGYGMSEGTSTEQGLYEDANAAIDWLKAQGANPDQTICYGYSLGAIPAIDRAAYRSDFKFSKLIIESPLASVENLVHSSTLINVSSGFVTTLEFPNAEKIKDVTCPLLWMHGIDDSYIEIENGELIFANYSGTTKTAVRVAGSDHSEVPTKLGIPTYLETVLNFIRN